MLRALFPRPPMGIVRLVGDGAARGLRAGISGDDRADSRVHRWRWRAVVERGWARTVLRDLSWRDTVGDGDPRWAIVEVRSTATPVPTIRGPIPGRVTISDERAACAGIADHRAAELEGSVGLASGRPHPVLSMVRHPTAS